VKRGFTIIELLVAGIVACIAVVVALGVLRNQNSNMLNIRQRVQAQTSARDGLKILESELRASGFSTNLTLTGPQQITAITTTCGNLTNANGTSVFAGDGTGANNDTLYVAYPMTVTATSTVVGTDCSSVQWSMYSVDASRNLNRTTSQTLAGLATSTATTVVARNVDVFQVRMGLMGAANPPATVLVPATEAIPGAAAWTTKSSASTSGSMTITPTANSSKWYVLSPNDKTLAKGERIRIAINILPNAAYFTDLTTPNTGTLSVGIFDNAGNAVAVKQILTIPAATQALAGLDGSLSYSFDLVDPAGGSNRRIGFSGKSGATPGSIAVDSMNATRVGAGVLAWPKTWYTDPSAMAASDWARTKAVEVFLLTRSTSNDGAKATNFPGLANYNSGAGTFAVTDGIQRVLFDHVYPVGNNGGY
jgi:Tfp pilus assembly protein PilV